jgi:hypothetical protein
MYGRRVERSRRKAIPNMAAEIGRLIKIIKLPCEIKRE